MAFARFGQSNQLTFCHREDEKAFWVPSLSPKGYQVLFCSSRYMLCHGSRKATKSNSIQHKLLQHCLQEDNAMIGIIVKGQRGAVGTGVWDQLCGKHGVINEWIRAGMMAYVTEPTMKSDTKMRYFRVTNRHGTVSEIQLHTLQRDADVESFKDTNFTLIYMVEADHFDQVETMTALIEQLRSPTVPHERRQIILDCNPPATGKRHWIYKEFIRDIGDGLTESASPLHWNLNFTVDDNPFISDAEKEELRTRSKFNQNRLDRNYYGRWVEDASGGLFTEQFLPGFHVIGDYENPDPKLRTILTPSRGCHEFPCGWDLGDSKNHAIVLAAKEADSSGWHIRVIDELVSIDIQRKVSSVTDEMVEKIGHWKKFQKTQAPDAEFDWRHWSDPSADRHLAIGAGSETLEVWNQSDHLIRLIGVKKGNHSVPKRITLLQRLLFSNRLFISASCVNTIKMLNMLKKGRAPTDYIDPKSEHRHVFDALTYMLMQEAPMAFVEEDDNSTPRERRIISIA